MLHARADRPTAVWFLEALIAAAPYRLHTVLTDTGIQFVDLPRNRDGWTARYRVHRFDQLRRHLADFVTAYNFAGRLKTLTGLTPFEAI